MDAHDVLLLPSKVESFGTVALEGMVRGRLVIVTASCGIAEWPELANVLYVVANDETPSQTLGRLCSLSSDARLEVGELARQCAVDLHAWNISSWMHTLQRVQSRDGACEVEEFSSL